MHVLGFRRSVFQGRLAQKGIPWQLFQLRGNLGAKSVSKRRSTHARACSISRYRLPKPPLSERLPLKGRAYDLLDIVAFSWGAITAPSQHLEPGVFIMNDVLVSERHEVFVYLPWLNLGVTHKWQDFRKW